MVLFAVLLVVTFKNLYLTAHTKPLRSQNIHTTGTWEEPQTLFFSQNRNTGFWLVWVVFSFPFAWLLACLLESIFLFSVVGVWGFALFVVADTWSMLGWGFTCNAPVVPAWDGLCIWDLHRHFNRSFPSSHAPCHDRHYLQTPFFYLYTTKSSRPVMRPSHRQPIYLHPKCQHCYSRG